MMVFINKEDGHYRPKHVVLLANKHHHLAIIYSRVF